MQHCNAVHRSTHVLCRSHGSMQHALQHVAIKKAETRGPEAEASRHPCRGLFDATTPGPGITMSHSLRWPLVPMGPWQSRNVMVTVSCHLAKTAANNAANASAPRVARAGSTSCATSSSSLSLSTWCIYLSPTNYMPIPCANIKALAGDPRAHCVH